MPIYEYACKDCQHQFEALVYGSQKAECPKCASKKLTPKLSVFAVSAPGSATKASGPIGACGSCGDPLEGDRCAIDENLARRLLQQDRDRQRQRREAEP